MNSRIALLEKTSEPRLYSWYKHSAFDQGKTVTPHVHEAPAVAQAAGNLATQRLLRSGIIQAKLAISKPGDPYEAEADRVTAQIMLMPDPNSQMPPALGAPISEVTIQAKAASPARAGSSAVADGFVHSFGTGQPLDLATRTFFEPHFGTDLRSIRVYTDAHADESASGLGARAFTVGQHVIFRSGEYEPDTLAGKRLLAHELVHVAQQGGHYPSADVNSYDTAQKLRIGSSAVRIARFVAYSPFPDPEQVTGVLPFTPEGWDGTVIAQRLTQVAAVEQRAEFFRCVETSFLTALVLRGPVVVHSTMEHYQTRYQNALAHPGLSSDQRSRLQLGIINLTALIQRLDNRTLTYQDLGVMQGEMFSIFGRMSARWTEDPEAAQMTRAEGYTVTWIHSPSVGRGRVSQWARRLQPGDYLDCGVDSTEEGTGAVNHAVQIGRDREGRLYLYNPLPVQGNQLIFLSDDLHEIDGYFVNRQGGVIVSQRNFVLVAWYHAPANP